MTADRCAALVEKVAHMFRYLYAYESDRMNAATAAIDLIRAETLEEAAKELERFGGLGLAAKIRALKEAPCSSS